MNAQQWPTTGLWTTTGMPRLLKQSGLSMAQDRDPVAWCSPVCILALVGPGVVVLI
jgi:hypothetical protein